MWHNVSMNEFEDIESGMQRVVLDTRELYPNYEEHRQFEDRLREFLKVDTISKIVEYDDGLLSYLTESVIPTKQDSRPPLLLLFGNPAPNSVRNKCFFATEKGKRAHQFWPVLEKAGIISFENTNEDINAFRTKSLFDPNYKSSFRVGLAVFYSMPSPASDPRWGGVAGLSKLFGARAFQDITSCEKKRVEGIIKEFIGDDTRGAVVVFQKDAYLGVKDYESQESLVAEEGKRCVVEARCSCSDVRLFRMPITRFISASWYARFLRQVRHYLLGKQQIPENVIENLRAFNRKERFFLIGMALSNPRFLLREQFRDIVRNALHIEIPKDAFAAMDYHLDWIYASLFLAFNDVNGRVFPNVDGLITATQEDIDFLIAYQDGDKCHLVLLEAKGVMGFTNRQLQSKIRRLRDIFGHSGDKYHRVIPHFATVSPKEPVGIRTNNWPSWVLRDGKIPWIEMTIPGGRKRITRCDETGRVGAEGRWWKTV